MARGTLSDPFKYEDPSPMKRVSGSHIGSAGGAIIGSIIPGVGTAIGGAVGGVIGGLCDKGGRGNQPAQTQPSAAELETKRLMQEYKDSEFQGVNPYAGMQMDLQTAQFQREQQAQEQADVLQSLRGGASGAGAAALATSLMRSSTEKQRQIAADISKQEQNIKMQAAQAEMNLQQQEQAFNTGKLETLLGMSMAEVTAERQAQLAAEQGKMNRSSQLLGAGLSFLGDIAPSVIDGLSTAPTNTTNNTSQTGVDTVLYPSEGPSTISASDYNFYERD